MDIDNDWFNHSENFIDQQIQIFLRKLSKDFEQSSRDI